MYDFNLSLCSQSFYHKCYDLNSSLYGRGFYQGCYDLNSPLCGWSFYQGCCDLNSSLCGRSFYRGCCDLNSSLVDIIFTIDIVIYTCHFDDIVFLLSRNVQDLVFGKKWLEDALFVLFILAYERYYKDFT